MDLKPCPFCGADFDKEISIFDGHRDFCFFMAIQRRGVNAEEQNEAWNSRVGHIDAEKISEAMVDCMQSAFVADPNAMHSLVCNSVPCNQALADHPHVVVNDVPVLTSVLYRVSLMGVISGILDAAGLPKIAHKWSEPIYEDGGREFLGFCRYQPTEAVETVLPVVNVAAKIARDIEHMAELSAARQYPLPTVVELWEFYTLLEELRHEEGATIEFGCRNPEQGENELPAECVSVNDLWTHWLSKDFRGKSLLECLQKAVHARNEERARNPDFRRRMK